MSVKKAADSPGTLEKFFAFFSLAFLIGNPIDLLIFGSVGMSYNETRNGLEMLLSCLIYIIAFLLFMARWKKNLYRLIEKERLIWLAIFVAFLTVASTLWSSVPDITLRRSVILFLSTLYGLYFGTRYTLKQQLAFLAGAFGLAIAMSFFFGLALPQYGVMTGLHQGAWRGVYGGKNGLGGSMAMSAMLFLILLLSEDKKKRITWINLILSVALLLLSRSSTALVAFISIVLFLILYRALRLRYSVMIPVLILMLLATSGFIMIVVSQQEALVGLLGKDLTFTGRTDIWVGAWDAIQHRPLLGYGYQGFWWPENNEATRIWRTVGWAPTHPHNGLLKMLLEIGWFGTLVFLASYLIAFIKSLVLMTSTKSAEYYWPICLLTFMFLTTLTESNVLNANINWILYLGVCLHKAEYKSTPDVA